MLGSNNDYIEVYRKYMSEINYINKSIRAFKLKKSRIIKKEIFASHDEVVKLEKSLYDRFSDSKYVADDVNKNKDKLKSEVNDITKDIEGEATSKTDGSIVEGNSIDNSQKSIELNSIENTNDIIDDNLSSSLFSDEADDFILDKLDIIGAEDSKNLDSREKIQSSNDSTIEDVDLDDNLIDTDIIDDENLFTNEDLGLDDEVINPDLLTEQLDSEKNIIEIEDIDSDVIDGYELDGDTLGRGTDLNIQSKREYTADHKPVIDSSLVNEKIYEFTNGDVYIGAIVNGNMDGMGSYIFDPKQGLDTMGNVEYIGEFKDNIREGGGTFIYKNGNEYIGNFSDNISNGIGRMKYKNGDEYLGHWKNGKKDGHGIYTWRDGSIYIGDFSNSKMQGHGICYDSNGDLVYEGEWKDNLLDGRGIYIWDDGKYYEGEFKKGKKHGDGKFYVNDELIFEGSWRQDKPYVFNKSFEELFKLLAE